jgi:hypothetical protein
MTRWEWRPFRANPKPEPEPALELEPESAHNAPLALEPEPSPVPQVSDRVQHAANTLAQRVWDANAQPRPYLLDGIKGPNADRFLAYAIVMGWVMRRGRGSIGMRNSCCMTVWKLRVCCRLGLVSSLR